MSRQTQSLHSTLSFFLSLFERTYQGCAVSRYSLGRACIEAIFTLGIGLERHIYGCRSVSRVEKIHFAYTNDTFCVSTGLKTVLQSVLKDTLMCVEHKLDLSLPFPQIWVHRVAGQVDREAVPRGVPSVERQNHSEGRREGDGAGQVHRG